MNDPYLIFGYNFIIIGIVIFYLFGLTMIACYAPKSVEFYDEDDIESRPSSQTSTDYHTFIRSSNQSRALSRLNLNYSREPQTWLNQNEQYFGKSFDSGIPPPSYSPPYAFEN